MQAEPDSQKVLAAFFDALQLRNLEHCQALLESLHGLASRDPTLKAWHIYLKGILTFEIQHNWSRAERIFTRLLQIQLDSAMRGRVLYALGRSLDIQGRWDEAIAAFEQSLAIALELGHTIEQAKAWKHIAITSRRGFTQGDFGPEVLQQAIVYCQQALDVLGPITEQNVLWLTGSVWNTLGAIHMHLSDWNQAIACYRQDMAICSTLGDQHGIGISNLNLGEIYQKCGRDTWPQAMDCYRQALNIFCEFNDRYMEADALANLALLHQEMGQTGMAIDYYQRAIEVIESLRSRVSAEDARAGFFATVADTYANAALLCVDVGDAARAFAIVERARSRAFLDTLAARAPDPLSRAEAATLTLAQVQAALPADALLLEYFTTGLVEVREGRLAPGVQRHRFPPARTIVFVVARDAVQLYDLAIAPSALRPSQLDSAVERHFLDPTTRQALYTRLIAPAAEAIHGRRRLYIVPHGPLHYIPFQALLAPDGHTLLRPDGPQLIYGPSATILFRHRHAARSQAPETCLALGYNGEAAARLHFAEEEARSVARLTGGSSLAGVAPKKATLFATAANYRLLHVSSHGAFDPVHPLDSALRLAPNEDLTALDVLDQLRLRCDLVTLSACESGLSRVRRGDELVGLVRAFMYAGAPALICTLWRVDERSTRLLMERFYQEVQGGAGFAEALKSAQIYLMRLSRKEARGALVRAFAADLVHPGAATVADSSVAPTAASRAPRTVTYLKSAGAAPGGHDILSSGPDNEPVFANPYYWAPFILIGDHRS